MNTRLNIRDSSKMLYLAVLNIFLLQFCESNKQRNWFALSLLSRDIFFWLVADIQLEMAKDSVRLYLAIPNTKRSEH